MRSAILPLLVTLAIAAGAAAQSPPSEAQIRADVRANINSNATVTLRGNGSRQLNGGVYEFVHSITARYPHSEVEGVEIEGYHDVVYQSHGSRYVFDRVRVGDWQYFGLPDPSSEEILALMETKPADAYPIDAIDLARSIDVIEGGTVRWHSLESVTVPIQMRYTTYDGNEREFVDFEWDTEVRLYREAFEAPWTGFIRGGLGYNGYPTEVGRRPGQPGTPKISEAVDNAASAAHASTLPDVQVPEFRSDMELARYLYQAFRETTDRPTLEATIRAVLPSDAFVAGGDGAVDLATQMWIDERLDALLKGEISFREHTCPSPTYNEERYRRENVIVFSDIFQTHPRGGKVALSVRASPEQTGYRNGQPVAGGYALNDLSVYITTNEDQLAWLRSFDDTSSVCSASGQAVQAATQEAQGAATGATDQARGAVEGAVQEGRRRLGRLFGRGGN